MTIKKFKIHGNLIIQFIRDGVVYASRDHWVYKSFDNGNSWVKVCKLQRKNDDLVSRVKDWILRSWLVMKIRKNIGIHTLIVLKNGTIIIQYDGIYRYSGKGTIADKVFEFYKTDIKGPLKNGLVVDDLTDKVYFGEYNNERPYAIRIFRGISDGEKWEECYKFPEGRIKHIHSIIPDKYRKRLWICCGDNDDEAGLFYTDDDFQNVHLFKGGDQSWRMVSLIPEENALVWGSDAGQDAPPETLNYIYRWDFNKNERHTLACIDKPAYYSTRLKNGTMIVGTHFEPLMKREVSKSADLWLSRDGDTWENIGSFEYELSNRKGGTKYASLYLPLGDGSICALFLTPLNVKKYDYSLLSMDL